MSTPINISEIIPIVLHEDTLLLIAAIRKSVQNDCGSVNNLAQKTHVSKSTIYRLLKIEWC